MAIIQILLSVAIITLILLQQRSAGVSGLMGGGDSGGVYQTRRGMEKMFFYATIVLSAVFVILAVYQLFVS
ncbi:MAG TPA: preprotein translocase subunit SecG [Candidatus Paceibacterota bacterium]|nr:preprotein translocase subunit SecG [Candidatus Paceibacterota bacterium]